mgnify:CR=1 FL=1
MIFAARLAHVLAARDYQRWRVAMDAGLTPPRLGRLVAEYPLHGPTLAGVEALARVLSVSPAWLCGWESASSNHVKM